VRAGGNDLSLIDVRTGKPSWSKTFPEGSGWSLMSSAVPSLIGVIEKGEQISILDAATGKLILNAKVHPKDFENAAEVTLLQDRMHFYVIVAPGRALRPQNGGDEQFEPNLMHGLESVPSGGKIYAFDRDTGKLKWDVATLTHPNLRAPLKPGTKSPDRPIRALDLVLERFDDSPVLILTTARLPQNQGQNRIQFAPGALPPGVKIAPTAPVENKSVAVTVAIDKVSGKLIHATIHPESARPHFHALHGDARSGSIDFVSADRTIRFTHEEGDGGGGR
jgi:hypothetical protein